MYKHESLINKMTLEEKIQFCSGHNFWSTKAFKHHAITSINLADGPHGLRKQEADADHLGLNASVASTCFPTSSALASSWNVELLNEIGDALGKEAKKLNINVILGPGVNMKRNPLCGRNFEYFSEDPILSGKCASAYIKGVQINGVGTSLKHFALNNQELKRMSTDALVDERAMHEYYLKPFEIAVKEAQPTTVMCAYNKINGVYCSDNKWLLTDILRKKWGFKGSVISDWGATVNRVLGIKAGMDLEMPSSEGSLDKDLLNAIKQKELDEDDLNKAVDNLLNLIENTKINEVYNDDILFNQNHQLAYKAAIESAILLKNENNILPLTNNKKLVVIGHLAKKPRYQGSGSSQVLPTRLISLLDGFKTIKQEFDYYDGYELLNTKNQNLIDEAVSHTKNTDKVVLCLGLTDIYESEGFDRDTLSLPQNQIDLLNELSKVNQNIILVLYGGSVIEMPWELKVRAILHMQLSGQAGGLATADLLVGNNNPSGKTSETFPLKYSDVVNSSYYDVNPKQAPYLESFYVGYRYFDSANKDVLFPFGYGLSYTQFEYSQLEVFEKSEHLSIKINLKNCGPYDGAEIVQVYIRPQSNKIYKPYHELKGFKKVFIKKGDSIDLEIPLDSSIFKHFDVNSQEWAIEEGGYFIEVGSSSRDIKLSKSIYQTGIKAEKMNCSNWYYDLISIPTKKDFESIYKEYSDYIPSVKGQYDLNNSILELKETSWLASIIYKSMEKTIAKSNGGVIDYDNVQFKMLMLSASDNPLRAMTLFAPKAMSRKLTQFIVDSANGHTLKGLVKLITKKGK